MDGQEYIFGANIIENLTTGMYQDSRIIYREYIQNACDQIDKAIAEGIVDKSDACIKIWIEYEKRQISIEDNATGIRKDVFRSTLGNIANSSKQLGVDKGFRGIGRLAGLAYCQKLVFTSSAKGENVISKMECDAKLMRVLLDEHIKGIKHTASEVLNKIFSFSQEITKDVDSHFFKVEMFDINPENKDLLKKADIREYLSFVAPVPYVNTFYLSFDIYKYAKEHNYKIDEYKILINGEDLFKEYELKYPVRNNGEDTIKGIMPHEFIDDNGELLAWMWLGVTGFKGSIPKSCKMRSLRLRKENIQIGDETTMQKFFTEDRGVNYFVGEIFVTSPNLIPNSQRDYFNENSTRVKFEKLFREYVKDELTKIYRAGSDMNSGLKALKTYDEKKATYENKLKNGEYVNQEQREQKKEELEEYRKKAEEGQKKINKYVENEDDTSESLISKFAKQRLEEYKTEKIISKKNPHESKKKDKDKHKSKSEKKDAQKPNNNVRRTDRLSTYPKKTRKIIESIYNVIYQQVDEATADKIISAIEEELI